MIIMIIMSYFPFEIASNTHKWNRSSISHQTKKKDKAQRGDGVLFELGFQKRILKSWYELRLRAAAQ